MKEKTKSELVTNFWGKEIDANQVTIEKQDEKIVICIESSLAAKAAMFFYQCIEKNIEALVLTRPCQAIEITI